MPKRPITTTLPDEIHALLDQFGEFGCASRNDMIVKGVKIYCEYWRKTAGVCPDLLSSMEAIAERISLATSRDIATQAAVDEVSRLIKIAAQEPAFVEKYPEAAAALMEFHRLTFGGESTNEQEEFAHVFENQE